jgi:two-component system response regulator HydG
VISIPESEKKTIECALAAARGERGKAARMLRIGRTTLYRKMKQYGITLAGQTVRRPQEAEEGQLWAADERR